MATYRCPGCGGPYNGKKCRSCYYETFTDEASCEVHSHAGAHVSVDLDEKPAKIRPRSDDARRYRQPEKRPVSPIRILKWVVSLLVTFNFLIPLAVGLVMELADSFDNSMAPAMEPVAIPEESAVLYANSDGLTVYAHWRGQQMQSEIPIYVQNDTGYDLVVSVQDVILEDFLMNDASLYCEARDGSISMDTLYMTAEEWDWADGDNAKTLQFTLIAWDEDTYETRYESGALTLYAQPIGVQDPMHVPEAGLMYLENGIAVTCLGYEADAYFPEEVSEGILQFHVENTTDRTIQLWTPVVTLNGEETDLSLWCQLPPYTRTVSTMYLFDLEELGPLTEDALADIQLIFEITDANDVGFALKSDLLSLKLP